MVKYLRINYPHYNQFLTEYYSEKTRVSTRVNYYPIIINPLCSSMSNIDPITFVTTTTTTSKKVIEKEKKKKKNNEAEKRGAKRRNTEGRKGKWWLKISPRSNRHRGRPANGI